MMFSKTVILFVVAISASWIADGCSCEFHQEYVEVPRRNNGQLENRPDDPGSRNDVPNIAQHRGNSKPINQRPETYNHQDFVVQSVVYNGPERDYHEPENYHPPPNRQPQDLTVQPIRQPVDDRQLNIKQSRTSGQPAYEERNGRTDSYAPLNNQQGSNNAPSRRQPVEDLHPPNRQPQDLRVQPNRQPVDDRQLNIKQSRTSGQPAYEERNGRTDSYAPLNNQQGSNNAPSRRQPVEDLHPNAGQSKPFNGHPDYDHHDQIPNEDNNGDHWKVYSTVPLEKVYSRDGHEKLAGTFKLPEGGISSVVIDKSPYHQSISSVIHYRSNTGNGPVNIRSHQATYQTMSNAYPANRDRVNEYPGVKISNQQSIYHSPEPEYSNFFSSKYNQQGNYFPW